MRAQFTAKLSDWFTFSDGLLNKMVTPYKFNGPGFHSNCWHFVNLIVLSSLSAVLGIKD